MKLTLQETKLGNLGVGNEAIIPSISLVTYMKATFHSPSVLRLVCSSRSASRRDARGFSRLELSTSVTVLALLMAVMLPALAHDRSRSSRINCANNLRQIGAGFQVWGNDHGDRPPYYVFPGDGGTRLHSLAANPWLHFSWISNELNSARVLLCPSDTGQPADDFSPNAKGGYLNSNYRNNATSYLLSHDSGLAFHPFTFMSGDRNVAGGRDGGFSSLFRSSLRIDQQRTAWSAGLHGPDGNVLRNDGQVALLTSEALRARMTPSTPALFQFILPR